MAFSIETEKTVQLKDRKIAGITAFTAFVLLVTLLCFIGYRISNPSLPAINEEMTYIPLDAQLLEQARQGSQAGIPAKVKKTEITPFQTEQALTAQRSSVHAKSGNSAFTNTTIPNHNPSGAKHTSNNPFGTGGINGGAHHGEDPEGMRDTQNEDLKPAEKVKRFLITHPHTDAIRSDENCKIVLSVLVDPNGRIVESPTFVKGSSTTNDITLINEVIRVVKGQAQFNTLKTAKNTKEVISIRITAN